jgi:apolipoprotein N-acyltransferase
MRRLWQAAAVATTGGLAYLGVGLGPWGAERGPLWFCAWLAPLPLLLLGPSLTARRALALSWLAWALGGLNQVHYLWSVLGPPGAVGLKAVLTALVLGGDALLFALAVLFHRALVRRGAPALAALAFASTLVSAEWLLERFSADGTFGSAAYSQLDFLPAVQLAALAGTCGISFALQLFAPALLGLFAGRGRRLGSALLCLGLAAALGWGALRALAPAQGPRLLVGLAASDAPADVNPAPPERALLLLGAYEAEARKLAAAGAQVVVLPEKLAVVTPAELPAVDALFQQAADETSAQVVVGLVRTASAQGPRFNEARWYAPHASVKTYDKHHLLAAFEGRLQPGTALATASQPQGVLGVSICKDLDFPALARRNGAAGVGLLLVPAWDFVEDAWLHGRMAILRGVESGFSVARAPKEGLLAVSNGRGRVLAGRPSWGGGRFATLLAEVPVAHEPTFYAAHGDWFAGITLALWLGLAACLVSWRGRAGPFLNLG